MNQANKTFNFRIPRKIFILISLISAQIAFADELNMMSTIDGESNKIVVESVDFQRLKSKLEFLSIKILLSCSHESGLL